MKRNTGAPAWADYTYQLTGWVERRLARLVSRLTDWRYAFLDRHCQCSKCIARRRSD